MKRRLLAVFVLFVLCLSLCSCYKLDQLRAAHGVWDEEGNIVFEGNTYRRIPAEVMEWFTTLRIYGVEQMYVTQKDYPVLLLERLNAGYFQETLFPELIFNKERSEIYIREDSYDEIVGNLTSVLYYDAFRVDGKGIDDDECNRIIRETLENKEELWSGDEPVWTHEKIGTLTRCTDDGRFLLDNDRFEAFVYYIRDTDRCVLYVGQTCHYMTQQDTQVLLERIRGLRKSEK